MAMAFTILKRQAPINGDNNNEGNQGYGYGYGGSDGRDVNWWWTPVCAGTLLL
jgi:hypothetical protein